MPGGTHTCTYTSIHTHTHAHACTHTITNALTPAKLPLKVSLWDLVKSIEFVLQSINSSHMVLTACNFRFTQLEQILGKVQ